MVIPLIFKWLYLRYTGIILASSALDASPGGILKTRQKDKEWNLAAEVEMEYFQSILEKFYGLVEWLWKNGGWWSVIGGISIILLFGMKLGPGHQRNG